MIKFTDLNKKLKRDSEYIETVTFGSYYGNECVCLITFKSLAEISISWNSQLIKLINKYLADCEGILNCQSNAKNLVIMFKVKLS